MPEQEDSISAGREVNGEIRQEYILVEYFKKQLYSLARRELSGKREDSYHNA